MGRSGEHRLKRHFRKIVIISGVAAAVLAAGAWALASAGRDPGATRAALDTAPQADQPRTAPDRASRGGRRSPDPSASPSASASAEPSQPTETPAPTKAPEESESSGSQDALKAQAKKKKKRKSRVVRTGSCEASYYWQGQTTASGERFDPDELTAAHRSLPMGTKVRVINKNNGRAVTVRINDRGPFVGGRCLDLSRAAMAKVGGTGSGVIPVRYQVLARA
ncbi:septal ring lytic transglycosylase RlpA family protein [Actinomadura miaoliensis]|uniref:Probable endolytic peptidoglycan transglycosylase RlpA n=1 Tax=Actinomadura miaoliensis TaxID=430685 RepID=A0ABP7WEQ2_9ACTN